MEGEYGARMLGRLKQMHVLVVGMRGLGVEVAKNLILAGPHTVQIFDNTPTRIEDVGTNFYLTPEHVGQPRAQAVVPALGELNPNVNVSVLANTEVTPQIIQQFDVVCVTDGTIPLQQLQEWDHAARSRFRPGADGTPECHPVVFISSAVSGASGYIFSDFGDKFHVFDTDGVPVRSVVLDHISNAEHGVVTIDGDRHLLQDGDLVHIEEVRGMSDSCPLSKLESEAKTFKHGEVITDINSILEIRTTKNPKKFTIGDTRQLLEYKNGGVATQIKVGKDFSFHPLAAQVTNPTFISGYMDFTKFGRDGMLHLARQAVWKFQSEVGRWPALHSEEDATKVVELAKSIAQEQNKMPGGTALVIDEVDTKVIRNFALYYEVELPALTALFGGVVAQEITKATGKYTPIQQFFHYDAFELLQENPPKDAAPKGTRYDHQIAVFGAGVQEALMKQHVFLVGCGALGCEYIKAFALMGLGTKGGSITMTDDDRIELSNLSRQFLFRRKHVGSAKSKSAAATAVHMNPELGPILNAMEKRVEPKTEDVFNDTFWNGLTMVVNALDNQIARKYVDSKCVLHKKPLFESGTLGTQANSVICLPGKTPSYAEGAVAGEEQGIAKCTLRNFPSLDIHCIEWSREKFDDLFMSGADAFNSLLEDREQFLAKLKQDPLSEADALRAVSATVQLARGPSFEKCARVMVTEFARSFRDAINDLTHAFPEDARVKDPATGADLGLFWHGHKRFPRSAKVSPDNDALLEFVHAGANILASVFHLPEASKEEVRRLLPKLVEEVPDWKPSGAKIKLDEGKKGGEADESKQADGEEQPSEEDAETIARLTSELRGLDLAQFKPLNPAEFEKDNDANHHIDWITATTNLRCWNYHIKETTRQKCRMIAGKIIPAIATTTATITGFIGVELYKYVMGAALEQYRAASINLASNIFCVENLPDPIHRKDGFDVAMNCEIKAIPPKHTIWDEVLIQGDEKMTLQQFLDLFTEKHHGCTISTLIPIAGGAQGKILYNDMDLYSSKKDEVKRRLSTPLLQVWQEVVGSVFPADRTFLLFDVGAEDADGNMAIVPTVKFQFK